MIDKSKYPNNSIKKPDISKVTKGKVRRMEEPLLMKIFGGETASNIGSYILWDVLVPALKSTITDMIINATEMIFYGTGKRTRNRQIRRDRGRSIVSYNSMYDRRPSRERSRPDDPHRFEEIVFESRADAEMVLSTLVDMIDQYGLATVEEFYEAAGLEAEFTDSKFGWESLVGASVAPIKGGWILDLPRPRVV